MFVCIHIPQTNLSVGVLAALLRRAIMFHCNVLCDTSLQTQCSFCIPLQRCTTLMISLFARLPWDPARMLPESHSDASRMPPQQSRDLSHAISDTRTQPRYLSQAISSKKFSAKGSKTRDLNQWISAK